MPIRISQLSVIDPRAEIGPDVEIGPFCTVGPHVRIGAGTRLESHVVITGDSTIGERNSFSPNVVIGGDPQDKSFQGSETKLIIGDDNILREGVTINVGAEKEDHTTRIGNKNLLMSNSHVAHNCHIFDNVILVNGVLLGGHVHVHDGAIVSGNSVVHHFSTLGTLSFVSGGCRVPHDIPPYMLAAGSDNPTVKTINIVGMRRRGIAIETIRTIKQVHRMLYRERKPIDEIRNQLEQELDGVFPFELTALLTFVEQQRLGKMGRAREGLRSVSQDTSTDSKDGETRRAA
jgi:UDP-N-acetylglucosamine acyltransferase